jgi:hypothetical protein
METNTQERKIEEPASNLIQWNIPEFIKDYSISMKARIYNDLSQTRTKYNWKDFANKTHGTDATRLDNCRSWWHDWIKLKNPTTEEFFKLCKEFGFSGLTEWLICVDPQGAR